MSFSFTVRFLDHTLNELVNMIEVNAGQFWIRTCWRLENKIFKNAVVQGEFKLRFFSTAGRLSHLSNTFHTILDKVAPWKIHHLKPSLEGFLEDCEGSKMLFGRCYPVTFSEPPCCFVIYIYPEISSSSWSGRLISFLRLIFLAFLLKDLRLYGHKSHPRHSHHLMYATALPFFSSLKLCLSGH